MSNKQQNLNKVGRKSMNRHIFSRFKGHIRWGASLTYLSFGLFDYLYSPENFKTWMMLRFAWVAMIYAFFYLAFRFKKVRDSIHILASVALISACWPIAYMIYQTGGSSSLYTTGLILCGTTGLQVFRLRRTQALLTLSIAFIPTILVFFYNPDMITPISVLIQTGFLIGMIILSYIYGSSEEIYDKYWLKFKELAKEEINRLNRTEILKNHFPKLIREQFEKNPASIYHKKELKQAVVGFADIVSSTKIANQVSLDADWELKEKFLEAATNRAKASGMVVLTHLGDGFLFLANYDDNPNWNYNLISFYEALVRDFKEISKAYLTHAASDIETGVKFGVSMGPVIVGFLGKNQSYFTAIGPDVNLASRLCSLADKNEIVVTKKIWTQLKNIILGWDIHSQPKQNIKGFSEIIETFHIKPSQLNNANKMLCSCCNNPLVLVTTDEGFLDYRCPEGNNQLKLAQSA